MLACTSDSQPTPIEPGGELRHRGSLELRVPPGPLPTSGTYELTVTFEPMEPLEPLRPSRAIQPVVVTVPVEVVDDAARADSADAAVAAFAADPRLADFVEAQTLPEQPELAQSFTVELSWWRGAWELWVEPYFEGDRRLRMRYDPASGEIVDVRTVYLGLAPEDEPGAAPRPPGFDEPDEIIPPP